MFSRGIYTLFMNIYIWRQTADIQLVALFNAVFIVGHIAAFMLTARLIKKGHIQKMMKAGLLGMILVLAAILQLGDESINYLYLIGVLYGAFNGMYWMSHHVESFDQTGIKNRANYFAYRGSLATAARLLVPVIAWVSFSATDNLDSSYQYLFMLAMVSLLVALLITKVETRKINSNWGGIKTYREIAKLKGFKSLTAMNIIAPALFKGGIVVFLLPVLLFELLEGERGLSAVETFLQIGAAVAGFIFARYNKGNKHLEILVKIAGIGLAFSFFALSIGFNVATYIAFLVGFIISSTTGAISGQVISANFVHHVKNYAENRVEYILLLEYIRSIGFVMSDLFVFFAGSIAVSAMRPFLLIMGICALVYVPLNLYLLKNIQI